MTTTFNFLLQQPALPEPAVAPTSAPASTGVVAQVDALLLGCGVPRPLRRDGKGDYVNVCAEELIKAAVGQVLGTIAQTPTSAGELPWRPEFGSRLNLLRHRNNDEALEDVAHAYVIQALERWEPRVRLRSTFITRDGTPTLQETNILHIRVRYDLAVSPRGAAILLRGIEQSVSVQAA